MAFGIGINTQETNAGNIRGRQMDIACECWFTSKGKIRPLMLKYQDERGEIHTINEIQVHSSEEKNYAGIPSVEFDVTLNCQGILSRVRLIFFKKECRWVMNFMAM